MDVKTRNQMIAAVSGLTDAQVSKHLEEAYERSDRSWVVSFRPTASNDPAVSLKLQGVLAMVVPREVGYEWSESDLP